MPCSLCRVRREAVRAGHIPVQIMIPVNGGCHVIKRQSGHIRDVHTPPRVVLPPINVYHAHAYHAYHLLAEP